MPWNENLEGPALAIASSTNRRLRVLAGPGTGKTFALMRRLSRLLEEGVDPTKILLVTFTRMAANDLEESILALNIDGAENIEKGTLHAFCYRLLSTEEVFAITQRTPRTLLDFEIKFLLEDLALYELGNFYDRRRQLKAFEAAWATEQDQVPGWPQNDRDQLFHQHLMDWLRFHRAMVIGELVPLALNFLNTNPQSPFRNAFQHVLIDEYQDLNPAEQALIDLLAANSNLSVIGDADQSIYEQLRFAHPEGIITFTERHAETQSVPIEECRRCPQQVVEIASALIHNNQNRLGDLHLNPRPDNVMGDISVVQWQAMSDEAAGIANYLTVKIAAGEFNPGQILVLCPRRQIGYAIRDALNGQGVTAHSYFSEELLDGDPKNLDDSLAQQALTLFALITKPDDLVSLRCWLGFGHSELAVKQYNRVREYAVENKNPIHEVLNQLVNATIRIRHTDYVVERYRLLQKHWENLNGQLPLNVFDQIFPAETFWAENFRNMRDELKDNDGLEKILQTIKINISQPELPSKVDHVRIMSLQKSKGLTAEHVVIAGCVEGLLPPQPQDGEDEARRLEESRRLFYVALTRTRSSLLISSFRMLPASLAFTMRVLPQRRQGGHVTTITSRFITELGPTAPQVMPGEDLV